MSTRAQILEPVIFGSGHREIQVTLREDGTVTVRANGPRNAGLLIRPRSGNAVDIVSTASAEVKAIFTDPN